MCHGRVAGCRPNEREDWIFPGVGLGPLRSLSVLKPGPNRFPLKVVTTYESCLQPGGQSTATTFIPKCLSSGSSSILPPLPPGRYFTKVVTMGLPSKIAVTHSVAVSLLPSAP
jgi:hypothetical protein